MITTLAPRTGNEELDAVLDSLNTVIDYSARIAMVLGLPIMWSGSVELGLTITWGGAAVGGVNLLLRNMWFGTRGNGPKES